MLIAIAVFCEFTICSNLDMTPAADLLSKDIKVVDCQLRLNDKKRISGLSIAMLVTVVVGLLREGTWIAARLMILITLPKLTMASGSLSRTRCDGLYADARNGVRPMTAHFNADNISRSQTFNSFSTCQYHLSQR